MPNFHQEYNNKNKKNARINILLIINLLYFFQLNSKYRNNWNILM